MTSPRETNHYSHSNNPRVFLFAGCIGAQLDREMLALTGSRHNTKPTSSRHFQPSVASKIVPARGTRAVANSETSRRRFSASFQAQSRSSVSVCVVYGGVSCVKYSADRLRAPERSTDRFCATSANDNNLNKINSSARTEMSVASTATAFGSPTWLLWLSPPRRKQTWRFLLASMRARLAAGLRTTTSRPLKPSGSSSAKSCGGITGTIKRRPF